MSAAHTCQFVQGVADALNIPNHRIQRLVIVADVRDLLRVYVKFVQPVDSTTPIVQLVKDAAGYLSVFAVDELEVTPDGVVIVDGQELKRE